jgi:hypothetical protein
MTIVLTGGDLKSMTHHRTPRDRKISAKAVEIFPVSLRTAVLFMVCVIVVAVAAGLVLDGGPNPLAP